MKFAEKIVCSFLVIALLAQMGQSIIDIRQFGALSHEDHLSAQFVNQKAITMAINKANNISEGERVVRIPNSVFYSMPIRLENIKNVSIIIEGKLSASKNILKWPKQPKSQYYEDFISCHSCSNITISGGGKIDGRGYHWWLVCILNDKKYLKNQNYRPHLIHLTRSTNIYIHDITMKNSAQFHLKMDQCYDAVIHSVRIAVNTTAQFNLLKKFSLEGTIPLFPLNTDGIDPSGARMHIYNITVQNFDDVVVPKPSHQGYMDGNCTRDMLVENATVVLGVGMSIGSVPPNLGCNCIRNITFRNVHIARAIKGIYVKTNPGDRGTGLVQNIYYVNFTMDRPLWWAIYIGPQQMKEPDGDGPGCMLYPFDKKGTCTTQPRVTLRNITLQNVKIHKSLLYPVTIRCNVSNPCFDINFINVKTDQWQIGQKQTGYVCQYASGIGEKNYPNIHCLNDNQQQKEVKGQSKRNLNIEDFQISINQYKILLKQLQQAVKEFQYKDEDDEFDYHLENVGEFQEIE